MCAIIGYLNKTIDRQTFLAARDAMTHRGPDDAGLYYDQQKKVALGHRRLSIIDLSSAGKQPMFSSDGRYVIIFNGEIFNYLELKQELKDYHWQSTSDTEVLLAAFIRWGEQCLNKLNGQFAFAIYDTLTERLFCARDPLGIKPFFYFNQRGALAFASEIKALLKLNFTPVANETIIYDYLKTGLYDHTDETFFQGIKSLPSGSFAIWENNQLTITKYWDLADLANKQVVYNDEAAAVDHFRFLIKDALRLQFRSDVPVGLNLSSGLDSNSLYYFAKNIYQSDLNIFTGGISDKRYDEVGLLETRLNASERQWWHKSQLTPEKVIPLTDEVLSFEDQPYGGMPTLLYYNIYKEAGLENVKVLLEGQGVDEILAGYNYYLPAYYRDALFSGQWSILRQYFKGGSGSFWTKLTNFWDLINISERRSQDLTKETNRVILRRDFADRFQDRRGDVFPNPFSSHLLNNQYRDIKHTKLPRTLRFNDHISMHLSKELRVPYLDKRLVEFCFFLPARLKINQGQRKFVLKKAMADYLPEAVSSSSKTTFGAFQTDWFRQYFKESTYQLINSDSFASRPYFDYQAVRRTVDNFFQGQGDNSFFLWQLINLELWLRAFIDKK